MEEKRKPAASGHTRGNPRAHEMVTIWKADVEFD